MSGSRGIAGAPEPPDETADLSPVVLGVSNLTVGFGPVGERQALVDVGMTLRAGEIVALLGESGCGKSLTALAIMGLLPPEATIVSGSIRVLDSGDISKLSERELASHRGRSMGIVFQDALTALNPLQRVGAQVDEVLRLHTKLSKRLRRDRVVTLLDALGVPDAVNRLGHFPHQFSGGLRQRLMIAIALVAEPPLLIADEPTTALDATIQAQILDLLREIRRSRGTAVLFITHDMGVVADVADRVIVMYAGRVVESCSVTDLFQEPAHPYSDALLRSIPKADSDPGQDLPTIPGMVPAPGMAPAGCPFQPRCAFLTDKCRVMPPLTAVGNKHTVACWHPLHDAGRPE